MAKKNLYRLLIHESYNICNKDLAVVLSIIRDRGVDVDVFPVSGYGGSRLFR